MATYVTNLPSLYTCIYAGGIPGSTGEFCLCLVQLSIMWSCKVPTLVGATKTPFHN